MDPPICKAPPTPSEGRKRVLGVESAFPLASSGIAASPIRLLIVEDEPAIADTLVFALEVEGYATHWSQGGGDALVHLRYHSVRP